MFTVGLKYRYYIDAILFNKNSSSEMFYSGFYRVYALTFIL